MNESTTIGPNGPRSARLACTTPDQAIPTITTKLQASREPVSTKHQPDEVLLLTNPPGTEAWRMERRIGPGQTWQETRVGTGDIVETYGRRTSGRDGVEKKEMMGEQQETATSRSGGLRLLFCCCGGR
jgi:hypothetical protein